MRTTIYDIADKAGVSVATVSKVMNSRKGVNAKTASRICSVMEQMQFRPKWKASAIRSIAVVVFPTQGWLCSAYQADLISGLSENLFEVGYCVQLISCGHDAKSLENINRLIITHQIEGVVVLASPKSYSLGMEIGKLDYPHVVIGNMPVFEGNCNISVKNFEGGYKAGQYLWRLGHRKFGIVVPSIEDVSHKARKDGVLRAVADNGGDAQSIRILEYPTSDLENGVSAAYSMLVNDDRPTAVVSTQTTMAKGFLIGCRSMKLSVPEDVSLVGFEDGDELDSVDPPMTAIRQPSYQMGMVAARMLLSQIQGKSENSIEFDMMLQIRGSTVELR